MYPACLNLEGKKVTIVGGGKVAYRKAVTLMKEKCDLHIIAPSFIEGFKELGHEVNRVFKSYEEGDCADSFLVIAATDDKEINKCQHTCLILNILLNMHLGCKMTLEILTILNCYSFLTQRNEVLALFYSQFLLNYEI